MVGCSFVPSQCFMLVFSNMQKMVGSGAAGKEASWFLLLAPIEFHLVWSANNDDK